MADFSEAHTRCKIFPAVGRPINCEFEETLAEAVYEHLRSYVRATGEAEEHPETGHIMLLRISDVVPLEGDAVPMGVSPDQFWQEQALEELAAEQGIHGPQSLEALIGAGSSLWADDADLDEFVSEIQARRADGLAREKGHR